MVDQPPDGLRVDHLLRISSRRAGDALVVLLRGEIDAFTAPKLHIAMTELLRQATGELIVVDLTEVSFLGSRGVAALVDAATTAGRRHRQLRLVVGGSRPVLRPLHVLGLDSVLALCDTVAEALNP